LTTKDIWLSQQQIALLFDTAQQNINLHINSILHEGVLLKEATHSVKRQVEHYNPGMIITIDRLSYKESFQCRSFNLI
jgi:hypothetical protein